MTLPVGADEAVARARQAAAALVERAKPHVEGGGAVGVAALLTGRGAPARTGVTGVVLSARLATTASDEVANPVEVERGREGVDLHVRETAVHAVPEGRDREHAEAALAATGAVSYEVTEGLRR